MLSHISRSVALSMLGYSCLAHSYWQRCHKTGLWGAISGEEETVVELTRRRPYACPVDSLPQALCAHPSLHCIIYSFAPACRTSDFFELSLSLSIGENMGWLCTLKPLVESENDKQNYLLPLSLSEAFDLFNKTACQILYFKSVDSGLW